jgi:hypothetical protein
MVELTTPGVGDTAVGVAEGGDGAVVAVGVGGAGVAVDVGGAGVAVAVGGAAGVGEEDSSSPGGVGVDVAGAGVGVAAGGTVVGVGGSAASGVPSVTVIVAIIRLG